MSYRPHDLLRLSPSGFEAPDDAPAWAENELARDEPWVIVRRAPGGPGTVAVGVRGAVRHERYALSVPASCVRERVTPEMLAGERRWRTIRTSRGRLPALVALEGAAELLESYRISWGPVGSAGFELASGLPAITESSDLDLILRCPDPLSHALAREILDEFARLPARADAQIDVGHGSLALAEWANHEPANEQVMLRLAEGPVLTREPWRERMDVLAEDRR